MRVWFRMKWGRATREWFRNNNREGKGRIGLHRDIRARNGKQPGNTVKVSREAGNREGKPWLKTDFALRSI